MKGQGKEGAGGGYSLKFQQIKNNKMKGPRFRGKRWKLWKL